MQALAAATEVPTARLAIAVRPGVTMPDWSAVTSGIVRDALAAVFETCDWRARWAGFDEAQDRTRRAILESYPRIGHAPTIGDLAQATGLAPDRLRDLIVGLAARDMVVLDADHATVIGAYPFIDRQTGHRVRLADIELNAMCAIDALGAGAIAKLVHNCSGYILQTALAERNKALFESTRMRRNIKNLEVRLVNLQKAEEDSVKRLTQRTTDYIGTMEKVIKLTGLKVKRLLTARSEEHTSELQSRRNVVCRLLLEKKKKKKKKKRNRKKRTRK